MNIVKTTSIPAQYQLIVLALIPICRGWLMKRYGIENAEFFDKCTIALSCTAGRNWYDPANTTALIRVSSTRLYLYNILEAEKTTPAQGLPVGVGVYLAASIIHEVTHYIQHQQNRDTSELETTVNQLEFLEQFSPLTHFLLEDATGAPVESGVKANVLSFE